MIRYVISYLLPNPINQQLATRFPTIAHLHITLVPSFTTNNIALIDLSISRLVDRFTFGSPNLFNNSILYLPVLPPEPLINLHRSVISHLSSIIDLDLSIYPHHQLPPYLPHLSLDYNFRGDINTLPSFPHSPFTLNKPVLFQETLPNQWDIVP